MGDVEGMCRKNIVNQWPVKRLSVWLLIQISPDLFRFETMLTIIYNDYNHVVQNTKIKAVHSLGTCLLVSSFQNLVMRPNLSYTFFPVIGLVAVFGIRGMLIGLHITRASA